MTEPVNEEEASGGSASGGGAKGMGSMRSLVLEIARALVDEPDAVTVEAETLPEATVLRLRVAQADVGKVIGKQGRTARSLRTILSAASMKLQHRYSLDILEMPSGTGPDGPQPTT